MSDVESFVRFCESEFGTAIMDREAAYVKEHVASDDRILDVGCGIGSLEERFERYDIVGLDQSQAMVRTARERAPAQFVCGDARDLPIATNAVDAVVFVATLEFIPEVEAVISEAVRVLDPGGTVVALLLNTRSAYAQKRLDREGSYFQRMAHRDSEALAATLQAVLDASTEYFLGVEDETVVDSTDPGTAAITAVVGSPETDPFE